LDIPGIFRQLTISAIPILIAITFHEISHGLVANRLGDPTARFMGRLTLNPLAHIDLVGTIVMPVMLLLLGLPVFGYAKPVPINPSNFRDPKRDMAISAAAGPIMNLLLAIVSILIIKFVIIPVMVLLPEGISRTVMMPLRLMLEASVIINVFLAAFNLLPIPPLDGGRIVVGLLPHKQAISYSKIEPFGFIILMILIATGIAKYFVFPLVNIFLTLLQIL
jgi:Zn-dependent protease